MYKDSMTKQWHPAVITSLCQEKRSYKITTSVGVLYRKTQAHLKPYTPQGKNLQSTQSVSQPMTQSHHSWSVKQPMAQPNHKKSIPVNNPTQVTTSKPKRDTSPLSSLIYKYFLLL